MLYQLSYSRNPVFGSPQSITRSLKLKQVLDLFGGLVLDVFLDFVDFVLDLLFPLRLLLFELILQVGELGLLLGEPAGELGFLGVD